MEFLGLIIALLGFLLFSIVYDRIRLVSLLKKYNIRHPDRQINIKKTNVFKMNKEYNDWFFFMFAVSSKDGKSHYEKFLEWDCDDYERK